MSKRYIIEIDEEPLVRQSCLYGEAAVYKATRFNTLVFDEEGLRRLKPYEEDEGAEKAWALATRIVASPSDGGMTHEEIEDCFGVASTIKSVIKHTYAEAAKNYAEWEKGQQYVRIGDEMQAISDNTLYGIVTFIGIDGCMRLLMKDGSNYTTCIRENWSKTGRHFNIKSILDQIGERDGNI